MDSIWQNDLLFHVNAVRAMHGLAPVQWNAKLAQAAAAHVADLQRCGKVAHEGCDGSDPVQRIRRAGYQPRNAAENIGLCACDAAEVVRLWMQSENHRRNILHPTVTEMGADTRIDPVDPRRALWVQVFGRE